MVDSSPRAVFLTPRPHASPAEIAAWFAFPKTSTVLCPTVYSTRSSREVHTRYALLVVVDRRTATAYRRRVVRNRRSGQHGLFLRPKLLGDRNRISTRAPTPCGAAGPFCAASYRARPFRTASRHAPASPAFHRTIVTPFDSPLVSQAIAEEATLITTDEQIQRYGVEVPAT